MFYGRWKKHISLPSYTIPALCSVPSQALIWSTTLVCSLLSASCWGSIYSFSYSPNASFLPRHSELHLNSLWPPTVVILNCHMRMRAGGGVSTPTDSDKSDQGPCITELLNWKGECTFPKKHQHAIGLGSVQYCTTIQFQPTSYTL